MSSPKENAKCTMLRSCCQLPQVPVELLLLQLLQAAPLLLLQPLDNEVSVLSARSDLQGPCMLASVELAISMWIAESHSVNHAVHHSWIYMSSLLFA